MVEIANSIGHVISFDGRIIESFGSGNTRMHINGVKSIEVKESRKGDMAIMVTGRWSGGFMMTGFDSSHQSAIQELVTQVNAAIASTGLGG